MALACKFSRRDLVAEIMRTGARARADNQSDFLSYPPAKSLILYTVKLILAWVSESVKKFTSFSGNARREPRIFEISL